MKLLTVAQPGTKKSLDESMIPAINIVFLLLIFFMIAGHIEATTDQLVIPASTSETDLQAPNVKIDVMADGQYLINEMAIKNTLNDDIDALGVNASSTVVFYVHRDLPASSLDPVLSVIRQRGITRLQLATHLQP